MLYEQIYAKLFELIKLSYRTNDAERATSSDQLQVLNLTPEIFVKFYLFDDLDNDLISSSVHPTKLLLEIFVSFVNKVCTFPDWCDIIILHRIQIKLKVLLRFDSFRFSLKIRARWAHFFFFFLLTTYTSVTNLISLLKSQNWFCDIDLKW